MRRIGISGDQAGRVGRSYGSEDTRPVGGILYLTDRRLFLQPRILERFTEERAWEVPIGKVHLYTEEGGGILIYRLSATSPFTITWRWSRLVVRSEDFFLTHLGAPLEQLAQWKGRGRQ